LAVFAHHRLRGVLRVASLLVACALLSTCGSREPGETLQGGPPKRVIWIAIDSLRADHMGAWGYERDTSPWMDVLADQSATFDWAITPSHATLHSVAGYFTGRPFTQLGGDPNVNIIPEDIVTLAEALQGAGVLCRGYSANYALRHDRGYAQGFAEFKIISTPGKILAGIDEISAELRTNYKRTPEREFIYIHTMDVHNPYRPPHPYGTMFTQPYAGNAVVEGDAFIETRRLHARSLHPFWSQLHDLGPADIEFLTGLYDGAIRYTDTQLPELLKALEWDPKRDLLIISADHGEAMFEHQWWGHFAALRPTEIHVPLIMNYAGLKPARHGTPVSLMDLYPTIAELWGITPPEGLRGVSLVPALTGGAVPPHDVYSESALMNGANAALISGDHWYMLVGNRSQHQPWHPWPYEEYLYRFRDDPKGLNDLLAAETAIADELNAKLRAYNPRWAEYTPENIRGGDERAVLGDNVLTLVESGAADSTLQEAGDGAWQVEVPVSELVYTAEGLTPYEPLFLEMKYTLESGRLYMSLAPAEYRWPGTGRAQEIWQHVCAKPGADHTLAATVVPLGDTARLVITMMPGTKARFDAPTLRRMNFKRIEEWPHAPATDTSDSGLSVEERQRLEALGYMAPTTPAPPTVPPASEPQTGTPPN